MVPRARRRRAARGPRHDPPIAGGRSPEVDFRGQRRRQETHASSTDPQAQLYTKGSGQTAKLCYLGHLLTENRHGLVLDVELTQASGYAEREAALAMLDRCAAGGATLGADRGYDTRDFVAGCAYCTANFPLGGGHLMVGLSFRARDGTCRIPGYRP